MRVLTPAALTLDGTEKLTIYAAAHGVTLTLAQLRAAAHGQALGAGDPNPLLGLPALSSLDGTEHVIIVGGETAGWGIVTIAQLATWSLTGALIAFQNPSSGGGLALPTCDGLDASDAILIRQAGGFRGLTLGALRDWVAGGGGGVQIPPAPTPAQLNKLGQIGFNMGGDEAGAAPSFVFINRMKSCGYNGVWNNGAPLSQYGYPTALGSGQTETATSVGLERPLSGVKTYVLRTNATGLNFHFALENGVAITDSSDPHRVIFTVSPYNGRITANPALVITGATTWADYRPNDPIATRDGFAIYLLEHEAAYLAGEVAHPAFIEKHKYTARYRPMAATDTNGSPIVNISDATPAGYCTYGEAAPSWMPFEAAVALCNAIDANYHMTVPHAASDAWMDYAFAYVRDNLKPSLTVDLEYSNEVWNFGFTAQYNYASNHGGGDGYYGYGLLAAAMVKKARQVFGAQAARVRGLFVRQDGNIYSFTRSRDGVEAFEGKKLRDYFVEVSGGFYLGGGVQDMVGPTATDQQRSDVMAEVARYEATGADFSTRTVTQNLIDQIRHGGVIPGWPAPGTNGCLDQLALDAQQIADFARAEGIPHYSGYEGQNFHINANGPLGSANAVRVVNMFRAAANDPRVSGTQPGSIMRDQYAMLRSKGMTMQTIFQDFYPNNQEYGCWGCLEGSTSPDTNLWAFYQWYQQNRPDTVAFEINITGGTTDLSINEAAERVVTTFGGLVPASVPVLKSGAIPGMTMVGGKLSGTPTTAGDYPLVFAATDGGGREITTSATFSVKVLTNYRYFEFTPKGSQVFTPTDPSYRVGVPEVVARDGSGPIAPKQWVGTSASGYGGNVPQRVCDGSTANSYITEAGQAVNAGQFVIDVGPGAGIKPTSFDFLEPPEAPNFHINGVRIRASRNATDWVTIAETAAPGQSNNYVAMAYTNGVCNVPVTYPA